MDMVTTGQVMCRMETAYGHGILFAFFKNTQQAVAGLTLMLVDLFDETVNIGQRRTQNAQCRKSGCSFFRRNFTQYADYRRGSLRLRLGIGRFRTLGGVLFFNRLRQQNALDRHFALLLAFLLFEQGFAVNHAQIIIRRKVHQETEHLRIVFFQFFIDCHTTDIVHQNRAHPIRIGKAVVFGEGRQNTAQALRPVAWSENLAFAGCTMDHNFIRITH